MTSGIIFPIDILGLSLIHIWSQISGNWEKMETDEYLDALEHPLAEAGWMKGAGKKVIVYRLSLIHIFHFLFHTPEHVLEREVVLDFRAQPHFFLPAVLFFR